MARRLRDAADGRTRAHLPNLGALVRYIRRWEAGKHGISERYRLLYAQAFGIVDAELFTRVSNRDVQAFAGDPDRPRAIEEPRRADAETVAYFDQVIAATGANAGEMIPTDVTELLTSAYDVMGRFRRDAKEPIRADMHVLAARYALLIARMYYEAANADSAITWLDHSLVAAHAAGDDLLAAYILARRSNLAAAQGNPGEVIDLAVAARERVTMPAPIDAMARRHEAQGHAMAGNADMCLRRLDEAAELLAGSNGEGPPYASGFSLDFHQIQAAGCYIDLDQPDRAVEILEPRMSSLGSGHVRAYNFARLARGYGGVGEYERAAEVGREALTLARGTGATRAAVELRRIHADPTRWWD